MPVFSYKAADKRGNVLKGTLEAQDKRDAVSRLQEMGHIPLTINPVQGRAERLRQDLRRTLTLARPVSQKDVLAFTQDLATLLKAGLPVDKALSVLIRITEKEHFRGIIENVLKDVEGGSYLSSALEKHRRAFSTFYANMVKAGETGGVLGGVMERLGFFMENTQELKDYIRSVMIYPVFLVFMSGVSIAVLLTFVIPRFSVLFSDLGSSLPLSTAILLQTSAILKTYWTLILILAGGIAFFIFRFFRAPAGRMWWDQHNLRIPWAGELVRGVEVARFSRTLGTLLESGVPILKALDLATGIVGNRVFLRTLEKVFYRVKAGERLSKPLEESGAFPSLAVQMITVGEETGQLDGMLLKVAEHYEKWVRTMTKRLFSLLEPVVILVMGLVVGFIVISMLVAIFSINEIPF